jgi:hypothetical protein
MTDEIDRLLDIDRKLQTLLVRAAEGSDDAVRDLMDTLLSSDPATRRAWLKTLAKSHHIRQSELIAMLDELSRREIRAGGVFELGNFAKVVVPPVPPGTAAGVLGGGEAVCVFVTPGIYKSDQAQIITAFIAGPDADSEVLVPVAADLMLGGRSVRVAIDRNLASQLLDWSPLYCPQEVLVWLKIAPRPRLDSLIEEFPRGFRELVRNFLLPAAVVALVSPPAPDVCLTGLEGEVVQSIYKLVSALRIHAIPSREAIRGLLNVEVPPAPSPADLASLRRLASQSSEFAARFAAAIVAERIPCRLQGLQQRDPDPLGGPVLHVAKLLNLDTALLESSLAASARVPLAFRNEDLILATADAVIAARSPVVTTTTVLLELARRRGYEVPILPSGKEWWKPLGLPAPRLVGAMLTTYAVSARRVAGRFRYDIDINQLARVVEALGDADTAKKLRQLTNEAPEAQAASTSIPTNSDQSTSMRDEHEVALQVKEEDGDDHEAP